MSIKILIADDHGVVRQGLRMYLALDPELEVVGEARDGAEAVQMAHQLHPDIVLMDLLMPGLDGIAAIGILRRELPQIRTLALTSVLDDTTVLGAVRAGAIGYLLKDTEAKELCRAIRAAAAGKVQLAAQAAERLMQEIREVDQPPTLTERETAVVKLLAQGKTNKEIALDLNISEQTVKTHLKSILAKLGLQSRTQVALYAVRYGLVNPLEGLNPSSGQDKVITHA